MENHLRPGSKWNQTINMSFCAKSSNQGTFQRGDQAVHRRVRLRKTYIYRVSCWNIKQSRTKQSSDQGKFLWIKNLDHVRKWLSTGLIKWLPLIYCILEFISVSGTDTLVTTYENFMFHIEVIKVFPYMAIW